MIQWRDEVLTVSFSSMLIPTSVKLAAIAATHFRSEAEVRRRESIAVSLMLAERPTRGVRLNERLDEEKA